MQVLVTGAAGFIGFHIAEVLLARGDTVVGLDNFNDYYDVSLKAGARSIASAFPQLPVRQSRSGRPQRHRRFFAEERPQRVVHLGAQAGVRYAFDHPTSYVDANLIGFLNILEGCRHIGVEHLLYASSSSVYGANTAMPFAVDQNVDHPLSLYGATKKANELMAHSYAHLYGLPTTGLRFFTVYGPWGRPDMAIFTFTRQHHRGRAHRRLQQRPACARLHLHRRHRRRRRADARPGGATESRMAERRSRSRQLVGAVPGLQHRQQPAPSSSWI